MVKGVNKNVIEINDTGSEIFERIVFFVSPKFANIDAKRLYRETEKFTFNFDGRAGRGYRSLRKRMRQRKLLLAATCLLGAATVLTVVLIFLM